MTNQPGLMGQPGVPPAAGLGSGGQVVKIVALVVIGLVVLCGLLGSCLSVFIYLSPLLKATPTPPF